MAGRILHQFGRVVGIDLEGAPRRLDADFVAAGLVNGPDEGEFLDGGERSNRERKGDKQHRLHCTPLLRMYRIQSRPEGGIDWSVYPVPAVRGLRARVGRPAGT